MLEEILGSREGCQEVRKVEFQGLSEGKVSKREEHMPNLEKCQIVAICQGLWENAKFERYQ